MCCKINNQIKTVQQLLLMPNHQKKQRNNFKLTEEQKCFINEQLPKGYGLLAQNHAGQQKIEHGISNENSNGCIDIRLTRTKSAELRWQKEQEAKKKKSKSQKRIHPEIEAFKQSYSNQALDENYQSNGQHLFRKKESTKIKRNKKNTKIGKIENQLDLGRLPDSESFLLQQRDSVLSQQLNRHKQKESQSNKYSGSAETTLHLPNSQKNFCLKFLTKLKSLRSAWPFKVPVDPIAQGVPNYLQIIKQPMDLKTIEKKINSNKYQNIAQFHADINKILLNSYKFNSKETDYFYCTYQFEEQYHKLLNNLETHPEILEVTKRDRKKQLQEDFNSEEVKSKKKRRSQQKIKNSLQPTPSYPNQNINQLFENCPPTKNKYTLTQRIRLARKFSSLLPDDVDHLFHYVISRHQESIEESGCYIKIDFESMSEPCLESIQKQFQRLEQVNYFHKKYSISDF